MKSAFRFDADELRSDMIGGYDNNNRRDQQLVDLANQLRLKIQDVVMNVSVNYITDSITLPVNVPQHF